MNGKPKNYSVVTRLQRCEHLDSLLTTDQYLYIMGVYVCTYGLDFFESDYCCLSIWLWLPYGVASVASNLVSAASRPSAGASWQRPAVGRLISASIP